MSITDMLDARFDLERTITNVLPDDGEWCTLTSYVRKVDGVLQVGRLLIRRDINGVSHGPGFTPHAKYAGTFADPTEPYPGDLLE